MNHLIIEEVAGRVGSIIYGYKSNYPSLYLYYIFKNLGIENSLFLTYQVIQKSKGNLIFKVAETLNENDLDLLKKEIEKYFKQDIVYKIIDNQNLNSNKQQKTKSFISEIC